MMTRTQRAKQFLPFDAMKGLQEALRDREEHHSRVEKREITEEMREANSAVFLRMQKGDKVHLSYFRRFHEVHTEGSVTGIDIPDKYFILGEEKIFFEDVYDIVVTD